jgi:hypothetical protein
LFACSAGEMHVACRGRRAPSRGETAVLGCDRQSPTRTFRPT